MCSLVGQATSMYLSYCLDQWFSIWGSGDIFRVSFKEHRHELRYTTILPSYISNGVEKESILVVQAPPTGIFLKIEAVFLLESLT